MMFIGKSRRSNFRAEKKVLLNAKPVREFKYGRSFFGFTLIELLVVVSIIALLVSILLPALGRARAQARTVMCATRQKMWGTAFHMYASENDGMANFGNTTFGTHWALCYGGPMGYMGTVDYQEECRCPAVTDKDTYYVQYGINVELWLYGSNANNPRRPCYLMDKLSRTAILFTDCIPGTGQTGDTLGRFMEYRHDDSVNSLFPDGRVERISNTQAKSSPMLFDIIDELDIY